MVTLTYLLVQCFAYILDFSIFTICIVLLKITPITANVIAKIVAGAFAFFSHRYITFATYKKEKFVFQIAKYTAILIVTTIISSFVLEQVLGLFNNPQVAKLLSDCILIFASFVVARYFVFRPLKE